MIEIELLPRKEFNIILSEKKIPGKFGTWSAKRFSDIKKLSLKQFGEYLDKDLSFDDLCLNILCAIQYGCIKSKLPFIYTDVDVCEWIDEMGGVAGEKFIALCNHAKSDLTEDEKKNLSLHSNGQSLNESVIAQD